MAAPAIEANNSTMDKKKAEPKRTRPFSLPRLDSPSSRARPVRSFRAASGPEPTSCRLALQVFAPAPRFESKPKKRPSPKGLGHSRSPGWTRTNDPMINSLVR